MKIILFILNLTLICNHLLASEAAQDTNPEESDYKLVRSIASEKHGVNWFITLSGVTKYDGTHWLTFNDSNSGLLCNHVRALKIDNENNKWFATDKGVSKFDDSSWTNYTQEDGLIDNMVNCITQDSRGNIWFGTQAGVSMFDGTTWKNFSSANGLIDQVVKCIIIDKHDNKYFGTTHGVSKFNGEKWIHYTHANGKDYGVVESIAIDSLGQIWIGTQSGIIKLENDSPVECNFNSYLKSRKSKTDKKNGISTIDHDSTYVSNSNKFEGAVWTYYTTEDGLANNHISSIDMEGNNAHIANSNSELKDKGSSSINGEAYQVGNLKNIQLFLTLTDDIVYLKTAFDQHLVTVYNAAGQMIYLKQNETTPYNDDLIDGYYQISFRNKDGSPKVVNALKFN